MRAIRRSVRYCPPMPRPVSQLQDSDAPPGLESRVVREARMIAQARASADAGRLIDADDIDAWIDSLGTDRELPPPRSNR